MAQQAEDARLSLEATGNQGNERKHTPCIIVQGGGYSKPITEHQPIIPEDYENITKKSAKDGYAILMNNGTAVDAVEAAVRVFEDSDYFNAGRGAALNCFGEVECDAMIMDGASLKTGAVMNVNRFLNPVALSREIMEKDVHCALSAEGALEFARMIKFPTCNPKKLKGENHPNQKLDVDISDYVSFKKGRYGGEAIKESQPLQACDTVSAVAMDVNGNLACATSSGGIPGRLKGRVGDVPLVGCGGYANEYGAAATTGDGECIMKMTLAREVVFNMESGKNAQISAKDALDRMERRVGGNGGIIALNKDGEFGKVFNTALMVWASIKDKKLQYGIRPDEIHGPEQI